MTLSFIDHLAATLRDSPPAQKGQRTRLRLKIATAKTLAKDGYHAMRVSDISTAARLAEGSFYVYFKDKTDAALSVLSELLEDFLDLEVKSGGGHRAPFDAIRATNRRWIAVCRANAGLMRCILQLGDEDPKLAELAQRSNRIWYDRVAEASTRRSRSASHRNAALLAAYMLGGMMDELVRKLIIYPDPSFHELLRELGADDDAVADAASVIWLRVFHPEMPVPKDLPRAASQLAEWIVAPRPVPVAAGASVPSPKTRRKKSR